MKRLALIIMAILTSVMAFNQDISGQWNGVLKVQGIQLRLVFHITAEGDNYVSTMDSPDQGAKGIPVSTTSFKDQVLHLEITAAGIVYEGTLDKTNVLIGTFRQAGQSFPMNLSRETTEKVETVRPQEPKKPYPYHSEDIKFANSKADVVLAGTLTLPAKEGNFPAVVLISGSGPQNRNEELMGHKPFLVIADYLTRNGIAVLRFDDRGTAESTGDFNKATSEDFATDVEAAVKYLETRKEINKKEIGLMGHSEGGVIAPMVAANSKNIAFIVLLAGTGIPGDQLLLMQQQLVGQANGVSEADLKKAAAINAGAFKMIKTSENPESLNAGLTAYIKESFEEIKAKGKPEGMSDENFIALQVNQLISPWMVFFIKYDPAPTLQKVKCPVLAINGEKDLQVPAKENIEAIAKALKKGGNKNVTTKIIPGLNHLFQTCDTGSPAEYTSIEETFSPLALAEVTSWILKQVK